MWREIPGSQTLTLPSLIWKCVTDPLLVTSTSKRGTHWTRLFSLVHLASIQVWQPDQNFWATVTSWWPNFLACSRCIWLQRQEVYMAVLMYRRNYPFWGSQQWFPECLCPLQSVSLKAADNLKQFASLKKSLGWRLNVYIFFLTCLWLLHCFVYCSNQSVV